MTRDVGAKAYCDLLNTNPKAVADLLDKYADSLEAAEYLLKDESLEVTP